MSVQTKTVAFVVLLCLVCLITGVAAGIQYTNQTGLECEVDLISSQSQLLECKVDLQEEKIKQAGFISAN